MALLLRYRCHACGAHVESTGHAAWVRCGYCRALVGIDWQAWFESTAYAQWLRAYPSMVPKFTALQRHVETATAHVRAERLEEARHELRHAVDLQMEVTPQLFPPEVRTDAAYRERYVRYDSWVRLQVLVDAPLAALNTEMMTVSSTTDPRDPLPAVLRVLEVLRRFYDRLFSLPGYEDPDGMPPASRRQLSLSLTAHAWLPMLSPEQRLTLLRHVHGANHVLETHPSGSDDLGIYVEWMCPHCGLVSLQGRTATELICVGCYAKRPFPAELLGSEVSTRCGGCGHPVTLPKGVLERPCAACGALVRRLARTGAVEKQYTRDMMAMAGASPPPLPEEGTPGALLPGVSRQQQCLAGLGRQASWYATLIPLTRYLALVRRSLPEMTDAERAALLAQVPTVPFFEGLSDPGRARLEEARAWLLRP